nr:hypothetical protein BgiMline_001796 [Biomphalaria glabrata]
MELTLCHSFPRAWFIWSVSQELNGADLVSLLPTPGSSGLCLKSSMELTLCHSFPRLVHLLNGADLVSLLPTPGSSGLCLKSSMELTLCHSFPRAWFIWSVSQELNGADLVSLLPTRLVHLVCVSRAQWS